MIGYSPAPPREWETTISLPCLRPGFARAMSAMGYRAVYLQRDASAALALVRGAFPGTAGLLARASVFVDDDAPPFVAGVLRALRARRVPYVKVGDTMWGVGWSELPADWPFPRTSLTVRHTYVVDLTASEESLLAAMEGAERKIRKAEREGVVVRPVESPRDLAAFCRLSDETSDRVRARTAYTRFPPAFFQRLHAELGPGGAARFYVAWLGDEPLAGCVFLCSETTMLYYLGGSTRDRALTGKQAPAAVFWRAMRDARRLGLTRFDFGGCTPTEDASDPRHGVYRFKKAWGGKLETFANLEVVLSPTAHRLQERVLSPLWDRLHPLYFRLRGRGEGG